MDGQHNKYSYGIQGHCRTNLDDYVMTVNIFASVPIKGDYVTCIKDGKETWLKVCSITHSSHFFTDGYGTKHHAPYIIVELNN